MCVQDLDTGFSKGFAFVTVDNWDTANKILEKDWHQIGRSVVSPNDGLKLADMQVVTCNQTLQDP